MSRHPLDDAFRHNAWATVRLIDLCSGLTPEQLAMGTPGTFGTIPETVRHIVSSDSWYLTFFRDEGFVRVHEDQPADLADLRAATITNGALWVEVLADAPDPDRQVEEIDGAERYLAPVGVRLAQVVHHGTDHRSQICTALTILGIEPPDLSVWAYGEETGRSPGDLAEPRLAESAP
jgi:uncharacterized damage-inducible protein DinB